LFKFDIIGVTVTTNFARKPMLDKIKNKCEPRQLGLPLELRAESPLWRPIHYLGSKLRLVDSIRENLADLDPASGKACDLFAGSGTVSMALSTDRDVVAADIQEYSRVLCTALLQPAFLEDSTVDRLFEVAEQKRHRLEQCLEPILEFEQRAIECAFTKPALLCDVVEHGSLLSAKEGRDDLAMALNETRSRIEKQAHALMATRYFGGIYFSYRQALFIDCVLAAIDELPTAPKETCLAALLSTASSIVNSVGKQFAQPMRPRRVDGTIKQHLVSQMCRDRRQNTGEIFARWLFKYRALPKRGFHRIIRSDYREVLRQLSDVAVIYADPPYTRDHYSRFYHVLETLCLRDFPDISTTALTGEGATSRGLYRIDRHQSPFCIKSQAPRAFAELFVGCKKLGVPLLLSYSPFIKEGHPRLMTVAAVAKLAEEYYRRVQVVPAGRMIHSKLNKSELHLDASYDAEVFIICR
jgi:adenine-specific DNA methylase